MIEWAALTRELRNADLLDGGVIAFGIERGWLLPSTGIRYANEVLDAGDARPHVVSLAIEDDESAERIVASLRQWMHVDRLPSEDVGYTRRAWIYAALAWVSQSEMSAEAKLDVLEEIYAEFEYIDDLRECSRYYVPEKKPDNPASIPSPLDSMEVLLSELRDEFQIE